jgi:hypothetical protein
LRNDSCAVSWRGNGLGKIDAMVKSLVVEQQIGKVCTQRLQQMLLQRSLVLFAENGKKKKSIHVNPTTNNSNNSSTPSLPFMISIPF